MTISIAIIGAGMSGLAAAHTLQNALPHATISLFEKSRGVGRLATRYTDDFQFDFGAPHFRVKTEAFAHFLAPFIHDDLVCPWQPNTMTLTREGMHPTTDSHPYFISTPKMTSLGRAIAAKLNSHREACHLHYQVRVASLLKKQHQWQLISETQTDDAPTDLGQFDWVICTAPTAQAIDILPTDFAYYDDVKHTKLDACYTLMLGWQSSDIPAELADAVWEMLIVADDDACIAKVILENGKKDSSIRAAADAVSLTVYSTNEWSERQVDACQTDVTNMLVNELNRLIHVDAAQADHIDLHRWRYAKPRQNNEVGCYADLANKLIAAGDWCMHGSVEAAFLSGQAAAHQIIQHLGDEHS